jgi:hypothetical protein
MGKSIQDEMLERIMELVCEIEIRQKQYQESQLYDGGYAENVLGMIEALNIITNKKWRMVDGIVKLDKE